MKEYRVLSVEQVAPYYEPAKIERFLNEQVKEGWTLKQYIWQHGAGSTGALMILERG